MPKHYFTGYDILRERTPEDYCGEAPYPLYSTEEARIFNIKNMAEATANLLSEDTKINHFLEKEFGRELWLIYKEVSE